MYKIELTDEEAGVIMSALAMFSNENPYITEDQYEIAYHTMIKIEEGYC